MTPIMLDKVAAQLRNVEFAREFVGDEEIPVCILKFSVSLTMERAEDFGVDGELFLSDGKMDPRIQAISLDLGVGKLPYTVDLYAAPDLASETIHLQPVAFGKTLSVKGGSAFEGKFSLRLGYPSQKDLLLLAQSIGNAWFLTATPMQAELAEPGE